MKFVYSALCILLFCFLLPASSAQAQCSTGVGPSYTAGCTSQYFTSVSASGSGVISTVSYTGSGCSGSYYNNFSTQGIIATAGATVTVSASRVTGYGAYMAVFVDWNNNGTFELTELAGSTVFLSSGTASTNYNFTVPITGVVTGTNLNMRVYLGEPHYSGGSVSPPCSAWWGQSNDYYCKVVCPLSSIVGTSSPSAICIGGSASLTASGAGTGGTYSWSPSTGLSATTGSAISATPSATTVYTVTGTDVTGCVGTDTATITVNSLPTPAITPLTSTVCEGTNVTLTTATGTGYTYQWYNGATAIAGATNNVYTPAPLVTTTYSVSVTTPAGCTATSPVATINVNPYPVAAIGYSGSLAICPGGTAALSVSTTPGATYQWFNSGGVITGATNATYSAGAADIYSVTVTGTGSCATTSTPLTVTANPATPASVTTSGPTAFCAGGNVVLTANSGTSYTYQWGNTAGPIAGATDITYTAATAGSYSVTVTNSFGCSAISTGSTVVVNPLPTTTITTPGYTSVCFPNSILLSATPGVGYTYQWYNGVPAIAGATNATYSATTTGNYSVRITNTTTGCTAATTGVGIITVSIQPRPTASITASTTETRFCAYDSVVLTGPSTPGYTYQWRLGSVSMLGATNASYTVRNSGAFRLIVFNGSGCSDTTAAPYTDTVDPAPPAGVTASGNTAFCAGSSVTLSATPLAGYTYQWYYATPPAAGAPIAGATSSSYNSAATGYYHVVITSPQGCITTTANTQVAAVPQPVISTVGPTTFCEGINVALYVPPVAGAVYQWKRDGVNITGAVSANYIATITGDYICYVNLPAACASMSAPVHVLVHPAPAPVITYNGAILRTGNFYTSYQWYVNTVTIPGATSSTVAAHTNAAYRVMVTDTNGCSRLSSEFNIFNLAVENANGAAAISIYPNPATDVLHIDMPVGLTACIIAPDGRAILTTKDAREMNVSALANGMYMVIIADNEGRKIKTERFVKQ